MIMNLGSELYLWPTLFLLQSMLHLETQLVPPDI